MRNLRFAAVLACLGLVLTAAPAAQAKDDEATQRDYWSAAAKAATATIYAPSAATLRQLGFTPGSVFYASLKLTMICKREWNVDAVYGDVDEGRSLEIYQGTFRCTPDVGDYDAPLNKSTVKVAGATISIVYHGCWHSNSDDPPEEACSADKRIYSAYGTLPAAGGKKQSQLRVDAVGLSRAEVRSVLRSLRPAV